MDFTSLNVSVVTASTLHSQLPPSPAYALITICILSFQPGKIMSTLLTGASLVDQYPNTLVHIVGFKIIKKSNQYIVGIGGMRGLRWGWVRWFIRIEL